MMVDKTKLKAIIGNFYHVNLDTITIKRAIATPRHICIYILIHDLKVPRKDVYKLFHYKSAKIVDYSVKKIEGLIEVDKVIRNEYEQLKKIINDI